MFALLLASVLVSLLSFSSAAPTTDDCSQLTQPAHELHQIFGRWIFIEGFVNNEFFASALRNTESLWIVLNTTADNSTLLFKAITRLAPQKHLGEKAGCIRVANNVDLINDKDLEIHLEVAALYFRFLQTCADCLLIHTYTKQNDYQMLYFFGRNTTLPASDLETFRKQAECLQFPKPADFHYDTSKELCSEDV